VHELLNLVQQALAFRPIRLSVLLFEQRIDVGRAPLAYTPALTTTSSIRVAALP
jgi:hypothetical protein